MNRLDRLPFGLVASAAVSMTKPQYTPRKLQGFPARLWPLEPSAEEQLADVMTAPIPSERADMDKIRIAVRQGSGTGLYENLIGWPIKPSNALGPGVGLSWEPQVIFLGLGGTTVEDMRRRVTNGAAFQAAWNEYPWPGESWILVKAMMERVGGTLKQMVREAPELTTADARNWTTLALASEWNWIADRADAIAAKESRQDARRSVRFALALAAVAAVFTLGAGALGVSAGTMKGGISKIGEKQAKDAAKGLREAAKKFEENAPLFAAELDRVADLFGPEAFDAPPSAVVPAPKDPAQTPVDPLSGGIEGICDRIVAFFKSLAGV